MGLFKLKSGVGCNVCMFDVCVQVDSGWCNQILFSICVCFQSISCHWCPEKQLHKQHKSSLESVKAAAEFSTPTSHVQYSHSRNVAAQPTEAFSFHYSSVAEGMMQK